MLIPDPMLSHLLPPSHDDDGIGVKWANRNHSNPAGTTPCGPWQHVVSPPPGGALPVQESLRGDCRYRNQTSHAFVISLRDSTLEIRSLGKWTERFERMGNQGWEGGCLSNGTASGTDNRLVIGKSQQVLTVSSDTPACLYWWSEIAGKGRGIK